MKSNLLILIVILSMLLTPVVMAQSDVPESGPISARIGKMIYDRLTPRLNDLTNVNEDLKPIRKNLTSERDFNLVNEVIFNGEMITTYGWTTVKIMQLHDQIKDDFRPEFYRRQAGDIQATAKKVRAHLDELNRVYKFVKITSVMPLLDRAMEIYPQMANDLDVLALMLQRESKSGPIKEQKVN